MLYCAFNFSFAISDSDIAKWIAPCFRKWLIVFVCPVCKNVIELMFNLFWKCKNLRKTAFYILRFANVGRKYPKIVRTYNICKFRLDRDYFKLVLIFEKLPVSGRTEKFCGGFPIVISTKYACITFRNKKYNANCK